MVQLIAQRAYILYHELYRETAITLLKYYNKDRLRHEVKQEDETIVTPLTMLIEEMPGITTPYNIHSPYTDNILYTDNEFFCAGVAKKVFTMCATSDDDFELLEPNAQKKDHSHHPLTVMVSLTSI